MLRGMNGWEDIRRADTVSGLGRWGINSNSYLVGGLEHFIFHHIWDNPSHWLSYFSRWLKPPTRYLWYKDETPRWRPGDIFFTRDSPTSSVQKKVAISIAIYNFSVVPPLIQCGAPKIAKLVLITIVNGVYKPTYNWGAPHCRVNQRGLLMVIHHSHFRSVIQSLLSMPPGFLPYPYRVSFVIIYLSNLIKHHWYQSHLLYICPGWFRMDNSHAMNDHARMFQDA